jgi:trehalose 6-phosphate phosphatase
MPLELAHPAENHNRRPVRREGEVKKATLRTTKRKAGRFEHMGTSHPIADAAFAVAEEPPCLPPPPTRLRRPSLFLDLDGVLAPLAPTPDAVKPDARRTAALRAVAGRLDGRVAIVSGRTIAEIDRISDKALGPASGVHGLERRRADGSVHRIEADPAVETALAAFTAFAKPRPGMIVEDKAVSAGLHYRGAPEHAAPALALARRLAEETGLTLQPGKLVVELKTPGADKGTALKAFMREAPFAAGLPVMFGDDLTDEQGFIAASEEGGFGVLVGPTRATAARYGLPDVDAVLAWLEAVEDCE